MSEYATEKIAGLPRWAFDALALELHFMEHLSIERPKWTLKDAKDLEHFTHALMQATRQMTGCNHKHKRDKCGDLIKSDDITQVLIQIGVIASRMVLSGAHKKVAE